MTFSLNRRSFLLSLIALGASYTLPADATAAQVDDVWTQAQADPWHFAVNEWRTITDPDYEENETWEDIFGISTRYLHTPADVIAEVRGCEPLASHFQVLAEDEREDLTSQLESDDPLPAQRRRHFRQVVQALEADPDEGWRAWITLEGAAGVPRFRRLIDDWLSEPADYSQSDWFPTNHGSLGQAKAFFESLPRDTRDALGVVIVEGEHPGSSYFAAELRQDIAQANEVAAGLGLPFRFKPEHA